MERPPWSTDGKVLRKVLGVPVHVCQVALRRACALVCCLLVEPHCFTHVFFAAVPVGVHDPQVALRFGVALCCSLQVPFDCFGVVYLNPFTVVIPFDVRQ